VFAAIGFTIDGEEPEGAEFRPPSEVGLDGEGLRTFRLH
jgi:hypothetical protein